MAWRGRFGRGWGRGRVLYCRQMNPNTKLVLAGAILLVALVFFFFGQSLVDAPQDLTEATPTPTALSRTFEVLIA